MKKSIIILFCLLAVLALTVSCFLSDEDGRNNSCDHVWTTEVTGGRVDINGSTQTVGQPCTVVQTCTKCGTRNGSNINPTSDLKFENTDKGVVVSYGSSSSKSIIIPEKVKFGSEEPVSVDIVGKFNSKKITDVTVVSGIKSIVESAFNNCTILEKVVISDSVETIGNAAFGCCYNLTDIRLPSGFEFTGDGDGYNLSLFNSCYALRNVFPSSLVCSENSACFSSCYILKDKNGLI